MEEFNLQVKSMTYCVFKITFITSSYWLLPLLYMERSLEMLSITGRFGAHICLIIELIVKLQCMLLTFETLL